MSRSQPQPQYSPRTSSRCPAPGIFLNVEVGVSFSSHDRPHTASLNYTSRNMRDALQRQQQNSQFLMPAYGQAQAPRDMRPGEQTRRRRLNIWPREHRERGNSAPPMLSDRRAPISSIGPVQHATSLPLDDRPRPLQSRLGYDEMPWSMPTEYRTPEPWREDPAVVTTIGLEGESSNHEDPELVRDLEQLQQAMMTVDSLQDTWTSGRVGDLQGGPESIGWAVRRDIGWAVRREESPSTPETQPPPSYSYSQMDRLYGGYYSPGRPRSADGW